MCKKGNKKREKEAASGREDNGNKTKGSEEEKGTTGKEIPSTTDVIPSLTVELSQGLLAVGLVLSVGAGNQEANNDIGSKREDRSEKEEAASKTEANNNKLNPKAEEYIPQSGSSNKRRQQEEEKSNDEDDGEGSKKKSKETKELRKEAEDFIPRGPGMSIEASIFQPTNFGAEGKNDLIGALVSDEEEGNDVQDLIDESENEGDQTDEEEEDIIEADE